MKKSIKVTLSSVLFALTVNNFSYAVSEAPKNSDIKIIEANIGKKAPEINIESLFNSNKKSLKLADLRGKIVILEFWATWCEPCIEAVPHIEKMQKEFKNDLVVIAITDEKRDVIEKYLKTHPTNLIIGIDSKRKNNLSYPKEGIPHTILIDKEGVIKAITYPSLIDNDVIKNVMAKKTINLYSAKKVSKKIRANEIFETSFSIGTPAQNSEQDISMSTKKSKNTSTQELEINQMSLNEIVKFLHSDFSEKRIITNLKDKEKNLHLRMSDKTNDFDKLKLKTAKLLETYLDLDVKKEKRNMDSYVISVDPNQNNLKVNSNGSLHYTYSLDKGTFSGEHVQMSSFIRFLEEFFDTNIVDKTQIESIDQIDLSFRPNDKESFITVLEKNGFKISKENLEMEVLIISDK